MTNLMTQAAVQALAVQVGWPLADAKIIAAIAMVESAAAVSGKSYADADKIGDQNLANTTWGFSYGLTQVRSLRVQKGMGQYRDEDRLLDPYFNLASALRIKNESGFGAWTTFRNEQYKAYLAQQYPAPNGVHIVLSGQTLIKIAGMYGGLFTWDQLARVNGLLKPYTIYINQPLQLPVWKYTIRAGDTLSGIAATQSKVTVYQLIDYNTRFNGMTNPNVIHEGELLLIPHAEVLGF